jgi:RNA polymerase sigma factor (TIGR02999 family)
LPTFNCVTNVQTTRLQSAALVNEAYLRLVGMNTPQWEGRTHFFGVAAQLMRQILVDYARRHRAVKRGAGADALSLDDTILVSQGQDGDFDVIALDDALKTLAQIDPRKAQVVELRFLWRPEFRGDGRGSQGLRDHRAARLEHRTRLAAP